MIIGEEELRQNYHFVSRFEQLRKHFGFNEMDNAALVAIAEALAVPVETLRIFRHLRNALAHDDPVNRETLLRYLDRLTSVTRDLGGSTEGDAMEAAPIAPERSDERERRAFRLRAWGDPALEQLALANGFVSIGGDEMAQDVANMTLAEIREVLRTTKPNNESTIGRWVAYWRRFRDEARTGDVIALSTDEDDFAVGEFVGDYHYVPHAQPVARHRRAVDWRATGIPRGDVGDDLRRTLVARGTILEFKPPDAARRLLRIAAEGDDPGPPCVDLTSMGRTWR